MKISCYNTFASGANLTQQTSFLADAGFDAFELVGMHNELTELLPEIKSIISKGTLSVSAICAIHRGWLIDPDVEMQRAALEDITKLLDLAGEIGNCGVFVIPILGCTNAYPDAPNTGRPPEDDRNLLINQLSLLAKRAKQAGTMLWLEVINRYESPVANTLAEGAAIIKAVGSSSCLLTADFFHMHIEEADPLGALKQYSQFLGHIHAGDSTRTYPGFGQLDYPNLIRALVANKYSGYLTVDSKNRMDPGKVLPHIAAFLKSTIGLAQQRIKFENEVI